MLSRGSAVIIYRSLCDAYRYFAGQA